MMSRQIQPTLIALDSNTLTTLFQRHALDVYRQVDEGRLRVYVPIIVYAEKAIYPKMPIENVIEALNAQVAPLKIEHARCLGHLWQTLIRAFQPAAPLTALFIGSGPLPISALLLAEHWDCRVDCLDYNHEAYELGVTVAQALGLADRLHFHCADVFDVTDLARYDVVFLAALVGIEEKARVVQHLSRQLRAGQVLALRARRDLRTLFYADIAASDLRGFTIHTAAVTEAAQLEIVACKREGIAL